MELTALLPRILNDHDLHARWLNTFSYLEYIGFRKIVKSQMAANLDAETLGHAVEEGRHALMLKKLAVKTGGARFKTYSPDALLCGAEAEAYFQSLDRACENHFGNKISAAKKTRLTYLYVTWLVELRALKVYGIYQEALTALGVKAPLNSLLLEEDRHLAAVENELLKSDPNFAAHVEDLKACEEALYQNYLHALIREIQTEKQAIAITH